MRTLIVHDRTDTIAELESIFREKGCHDIEIATDASTARDFLSQKIFDLLVLDLTIPHRQGSSLDYVNASNLLRDIQLDEKLYAPGDVIGITRDAEAVKIVTRDIASNTLIVIIEGDETPWRDQISEKIDYIDRSCRGRARALASTYSADALIICALDEEFKPYHDLFELTEDENFEHLYSFLFTDSLGNPRRGCAASIGKPGQSAAASMTQSLIAWCRPRLCIMTGICGGIKGKSALGDVLAFETVFDWDTGKFKQKRAVTPKGQLKTKTKKPPQSPLWLSARPEPISIRSSKIHHKVRKIVRNGIKDQQQVESELARRSKGKVTKLRVGLAPAASGSAVVAADQVTKRIAMLNENIAAVDMESYGLYYAAKSALVVRPEILCLKGVSDLCDTGKNDKLHDAASYASAAVAFDLISNWEYK